MEFPITFWCGVPSKYLFIKDESGVIRADESRIEEMKEAGFNLISGGYSVEDTKTVLRLCEKHGLRMTVEHPSTYEACAHPEKIDTLIPGIVNEFKDFPALFSYHIKDEPNAGDFPALARIVETIRALDPSHEAYINLFPNYASREQLGTDSYYEHVDRYMREVKPTFLSYDHYHFLNTSHSTAARVDFANEREAMIYYDAQKKLDRGGFFDNLEIIREAALRYNVPFMLIILLTEHGPYRYLSEAEIRWEVYQALAYGASRMSYFTYWTPDYDTIWKWRNGMITEDGHKTQHYYDVQKINRELIHTGAVLAASKSKAVFHIGRETERVTPFTPFDGVTDIRADRLTVAFYENGTVLLANKDFDNDATVTITTTRPIQKYDKSVNQWHPLSTNEISLKKGDGEILKLG